MMKTVKCIVILCILSILAQNFVEGKTVQFIDVYKCAVGYKWRWGRCVPVKKL